MYARRRADQHAFSPDTNTSPGLQIDMNATLTRLPIQRIFHPTDFSQDSHVAFAHALKMALVHRAELTIMHVDPAVAPEGFEDFPRIRPTLTSWGLLPESSAKSDVARLGIGIKKVRALAADPKQAIIHHLRTSPTDLMVLATHQREGVTRWLHDSVAEPVSREMEVMTLFVPSHVEGFVSLKTGETSLHRLLLPISTEPPSQPAVDAASSLASKLGVLPLTFTLVHAGEDTGDQGTGIAAEGGLVLESTLRPRRSRGMDSRGRRGVRCGFDCDDDQGTGQLVGPFARQHD